MNIFLTFIIIWLGTTSAILVAEYVSEWKENAGLTAIAYSVMIVLVSLVVNLIYGAV